MQKKSKIKAKILLLEDDTVLSELLGSFLNMHRFEVDPVHNGNDAFRAIENIPYDLALLDICVPGIDGLEVLSMLRSNENTTPIIIVTGNTGDEEELKSYQNGTNLFHPKPIQTKLLLYQIRSILEKDNDDSLCEYKDFRIDNKLKTLWFQDKELLLSPNEFATMELLIRKKDHLITKDEIIENLYFTDDEIQPSSIDTHISRLRRKLETSGAGSDTIRTIRGFGYRLA